MASHSGDGANNQPGWCKLIACYKLTILIHDDDVKLALDRRVKLYCISDFN